MGIGGIPMVQNKTETLDSFIRGFAEARNTTIQKIFARAGVTHSTFTQIRKGVTPRSDTIRKLAKAMDMPPTKLFLLAGYLQEADLQRVPELELEEDELFLLDGYRRLPREGKVLLTAGLRGMLSVVS